MKPLAAQSILLRATTLSLLALYPLAWTAPLLRAGFLPVFGLSEVSILTGLSALWESDVFLAILVAIFAIVAPYAKTLALLAAQAGLASNKGLRWMRLLGRLAMADIFLVALYVTIAKGTGVGRVETAWGLYLFSFCVLAGMACAWATERERA